VWERSFVAMHVLAGGTLDEALETLPDVARAKASELVRALEDPKRSVRARALAAGAEEILRAVDETGLR
jgi:hypothetical protein